MIFPGSLLFCKDNSGARIVKCISLGKLSKTKGAKIGTSVVVVVKSCSKGIWKVQKGSIHHGVIIWTKQFINRSTSTGELINFEENVVVLLSNKKSLVPLGTRIFGPVAWELRKNLFIWVVLLSSGVF